MTTPGSPEPMRLLLVEDDDREAMAIARQLELESEPYSVDRVSTLSEAIERVRSGEYDCALVDHHLPDGTAIDFVQATGVTGRMPVLLLTTDAAQDDTALQAMHYGAADFVLKSELETRGLSRAIRAAVERHRLLELRTRLHHAERFNAIGQLAAGVAHGINNPAAALMTYLGMLLENVAQVRGQLHAALADPTIGGGLQTLVAKEGTLRLVDEIEEFAGQSVESSQRITEMVSYLAAFSRGQHEEPEVLSVAELARMSGRLARSSLPSGVQLVEDIQETPDIVGHRARLCGMVVALVTNAGDSFTGARDTTRRVVLRTRAEGGNVIIEVEDDGRGMSPSEVQRAFEPFFTTARERGHVGLGLTVCRDAAATHDGDIELESVPGRGTLARVTLPLDTGLVVSNAPEPASSGKKTIKLKPDAAVRVLIIDDDPLVRPALARLLGKRHKVTEVEGGAEALALLETDTAFDVVVCDLVMPEIDGPAVYERVQRTWPALARRFLFLTGAAFGERAMEFVDSVDVPVMHKPVPRDKLFAVIDQILSQA